MRPLRMGRSLRCEADQNPILNRPRSLRVIGTSVCGLPLEIVRHTPGSGVGILQAGWDVSAGVEESPDVDRSFAFQVEQQVRKSAGCHDPKVRDLEFVREPERSEPRVPTDASCCGFDSIDEADGCSDVGFAGVVATG